MADDVPTADPTFAETLAAATTTRTRRISMTTFTDGPAAGVNLTLGRSPLFLRVARNPAGGWDALDQLADTPAAGEELFAYRRVGKAGSCHIDYRDKAGRRRGAWYSSAEYAIVSDQPKQATMRSTEQWRGWCETEAEILRDTAPAAAGG